MAYGDYGKTTELEAVNTCLGVVGEQPVNEIPDSGLSKATLARDNIYELSRETQEEGLACNRDTEYELTPNTQAGIRATATFTTSGIPVNGETITLNGQVFEITEGEDIAGTSDYAVDCTAGMDQATFETALTAALVLAAADDVLGFTYSGWVNHVITFTANDDHKGYSGNLLALSDTCTNGVVSAALFTGGVDGTRIVLPATAISVDPSYLYDNRYIERANMLYDTVDQTFTITKNVKVDIIWFLEWTDLPEHVRRYITIRAARVFQKRYLADDNLHRFSEDDELTAKRQFMRKELNIADFSILDNLNFNPRVHRRS